MGGKCKLSVFRLFPTLDFEIGRRLIKSRWRKCSLDLYCIGNEKEHILITKSLQKQLRQRWGIKYQYQFKTLNYFIELYILFDLKECWSDWSYCQFLREEAKVKIVQKMITGVKDCNFFL
eukprot:TRINITY_DN52046_c0_g1_i1.p1 TRINITY_DN52046_c0_g1~~TRINITY_DN52046_c0_g1_i1.p1  ORF type:complete len:120 (-),score=0.05 TRINITY_DN52046_c0_g1_i1:4-363(-)